MEVVTEFLKFLYSWVSAQPLYVQVAIGVVLVLIGLYLVGSIGGMIFLNALMRSEKKRKEGSKTQ
jgi:hypothetical protein